MTKLKRASRAIPVDSSAGVRTEREPGWDAPSEPEHRPGLRVAPPHRPITAESMAADLAADPEFREWRGAEWSAELAAKMRASR